MARLAVIGIDGMDPRVYEEFQDDLPNFSSIAEQGCYKRCQSVFPPDSVPAWVTIFTGEHPAKHGWLDNVDYEDVRKGKTAYRIEDLKGKTFWDVLGKEGKRVCVINPLLAYPVWQVNGVMASGPVFISGEKQIYPRELGYKYALPELGGMVDFPGENRQDLFLERATRSSEELAQFGLEMLDSEAWDVFFISFFALDRIQHFFWRYCDPSDPLYPGPSALDKAIAHGYKCFDDIVGRFVRHLDQHTSLIIVSDHGHGQRPTMLLNMNEWLRQQGFLKTVQGKRQFPQFRKAVEITKNTTIKLVGRSLGERWLYRVGSVLPSKARRALKKSEYLIDKEKSLAWASEMGGGASVGGIVINPNLRTADREFKNVADRLLIGLEKVNESFPNGVIQWAQAQDQESFYPDIIFELNQRFAVGRSLFCPLLEKNPRHRVISGGHKSEGVLFYRDLENLDLQINSVGDIYRAITTMASSA